MLGVQRQVGWRTYTAVAIAVDEGTEIDGVITVVQNENADIADEQFRLTIVNAAFGQENIDVYEISDPQNPSMLVEDLAVADFAALETDLDVGTYQVALDTDDDLDNGYEATFSVDALDLGGSFVNAYASSDSEDASSLVLQLQDGTVLALDPSA